MRNALVALGLLALTVVPAMADEAPAAATTTQVSAVTVARGQVVASANGSRIGAVSRLTEDGSPQIIFRGHLVTVPLATISLTDGKLVTSLTPAQLEAH